MRRAALVLAIATLPVAAGRADSQRWQTLDVARQLHDTGVHIVNVKYTAGRFFLAPTASASLLYEMRLRYDEERVEPMHEFDVEDRKLTIGVDHHHGVSVRGRRGEEHGEMRLGLTTVAPLELHLELGAVEAELELGGIPIRRLRMASGAADSRVRFDAPNPQRMERLDLQAGAAHLRVRQAGNANAAEVNVDVGAGSVELDFGGTWSGEIRSRLQVAVGRVALRIPRDVGVRVEMTRFLASFEPADLVRRGDAFYSANWDTATRRLDVRVSTTFGGISIERTQD